MKSLFGAVLLTALFLFPLSCSAMQYPPTDKVAHFGVGYVISDQLAKHTRMTFLERVATVSLIAYVKEKTDSRFDNADFAATVAGALALEIKF